MTSERVDWKESIPFICPTCRASLEKSAAGLSCARCSAVFPEREGVIDLLPARERPARAQRAMEAGLVVSLYESRLWRRNPIVGSAFGLSFEMEQEEILSGLELEGSERVLDLACGSGIYTRPLARQLPRGGAIGLDLSLPMLRHAARRASQEKLRNVEFVHGSAMELPFPASAFDAAVCCGALHIFPDADRALQGLHEVLRPRGRLILAVFRQGPGAYSRFLARARRRLYGVDSFSAEDLGRRLSAAGFERVRVLHARRIWLIISAVRYSGQ